MDGEYDLRRDAGEPVVQNCMNDVVYSSGFGEQSDRQRGKSGERGKT